MADYNLITQARERGYSMDEIADKLSHVAGFDPEQVRARGYSSEEILGKLGYVAPAPVPAASRSVGSDIYEIGRQLVGGAVTRTPEMIGSALEWWAPEGSEAERLGKVAKEYWREKGKGWEPDLKNRGIVASTLIEGAAQAAPSLLGMGAAALNPIAGAVAISALFGGQQAQDTYDKGITAGLKPEEATKAAYRTGLIEGFGETVADVAGAKLLSGAGKTFMSLAGRGTAEGAAKATLSPQWALRFAKDWAANAVIQSGTEYGQGYGEAAVEKSYGIDTQDPNQAGIQGARVALGMSALLGIPGAVSHRNMGQNRAKIGELLNDPNAPTELRIGAAKFVASDIAGDVGKEKADQWLGQMSDAIIAKTPGELVTPEQSIRDNLRELLNNPSQSLIDKDIALNKMLGGENETLSARIGKNKESSLVANVFARGLDSIDPGHIDRALADIRKEAAAHLSELEQKVPVATPADILATTTVDDAINTFNASTNAPTGLIDSLSAQPAVPAPPAEQAAPPIQTETLSSYNPITTKASNNIAAISPEPSANFGQGQSAFEQADSKSKIPLIREHTLSFNGKPTFSKPTTESINRDTQILSDIGRSDAFIKHGFGGLDVPSQNSMLEAMSGVAKDSKILNAIIELIPIDMMNDLRSKQLTPEMLFHDKAMLKDNILSNGVAGLGISQSSLRNIISAITNTAAKDITGLGNLKSVGDDAKFDSASGTIDNRHDVTPLSDVGLGGVAGETVTRPHIISRTAPPVVRSGRRQAERIPFSEDRRNLATREASTAAMRKIIEDADNAPDLQIFKGEKNGARPEQPTEKTDILPTPATADAGQVDAANPQIQGNAESGKKDVGAQIYVLASGNVAISGFTKDQVSAVRDKLGITGAQIGDNGNSTFPEGTNTITLKRALGVDTGIPEGTILASGDKPFTKRGIAVARLKTDKALKKTHRIVPIEGGYGIAPKVIAPEIEVAQKAAKRFVLPTKMQSMTDERMANETHRANLEQMNSEFGWVERGGKLIRNMEGDATARTKWLPLDDRLLWQGRPDQNVSEAEAKDFVRKALKGEPLQAKGHRFVNYLLDVSVEREKQIVSLENEVEKAENELTDAENAALDALMIEAETLIGKDEVSGIADRHADTAVTDGVRAWYDSLTFAYENAIEFARGKNESTGKTEQVATGITEKGGQPGSQKTGAGANALTLEAQTNAEAVAQDQAAAQRARDEEAQAKKAQSDKDAADLAARTKARASDSTNFQFGENSKQAAAPVGDLFSQPASQLSAPDLLRAAAAKIEDFGGTIAGNRKDRWKTRGMNASDLTDMAAGEQAIYATKDNVWPKLDYAVMIESGTEPKAAALIKIIRDRMAAKPRTDTEQGRKDYVETVALVRDAVKDIRTEQQANDLSANISAQIGLPKGRIDRQEHRPLLGKLWSIYKNRSNPLDIHYSDNRKVRDMLADGWPVKKESAKRTAEDTKQEPIRPYLDKLERTGEDVRNGKNVTPEDFATTFGMPKVNFGNYVANDEGQRHVNLAYEALYDLANVIGVPPKAMSLNGTLNMAFGARGTKFAAHYEPGEIVINIGKVNGPGALSHEFGHALDHYFGEIDRPDAYGGKARGATGWYSKVGADRKNMRPEMSDAFDRVMKALYERNKEKAEVVRELEINVENRQADVARAEKNIARENISSNELKEWKAWGEGAKMRLQTAQSKLAKLVNEPNEQGKYGKAVSSYYANAQKLSGKSGASGYWARPTEMFARSFESFIFDQIKNDSRVSDYLVHGVEADRFAGEDYKGNPYPEGAERNAINAAFENLVQTLKTKETDQGIALQSINRGLLNVERDEDLDPDTEESTKVQAGIEGKTPQQAAQFIIATGSEFQKEVAQKVLNQLNRLRLSGIKLDLKIAHNEEKVPGQLLLARGLTDWSFAPHNNRITVWINGTDVKGKVGASYTTVLHELIHMATSGMIQLGQLPAASTYKTGKDVADLIAVTDHIRNHFNQRVAESKAGKVELTDFETRIHRRANNALDSAHEVLAWGLSNPEAQAYMESIPYPAHESAWTAFVSAIRRILGLSERSETAFTEILRIADNLMNDNVNEILGLDTARGFDTAIQMPRGSGQVYNKNTSDIDHIDSEGNKYTSSALYSEGQKPVEGMSKARVHQATLKLRMRWLGFRKINIVQSVKDLPTDFRHVMQSTRRDVGYHTELIRKYAEQTGWKIENSFGSSLSRSQYIELQRPTEFDEDGEPTDYDTVKIRVSDHELPPSYKWMNGNADFEVTPDGVVHNDSAGDWVDALIFLADRSGVEPKGRANRYVSERKEMYAAEKRAAQEKSDMRSRNQHESEKRVLEGVFEKELSVTKSGSGKTYYAITPTGEQMNFTKPEKSGDMYKTNATFLNKDAYGFSAWPDVKFTDEQFAEFNKLDNEGRARYVYAQAKDKLIESVKKIQERRDGTVMQSVNQNTEGFYDPKTNSVYLIADNISTPERSVWTAIHEVQGHAGLRMIDKTVAESLDKLAKNSTVAKLAAAIAKDRGGMPVNESVEESFAELSAAIQTDNLDALLNRYGVKVPQAFRSNLIGMVNRVVEAIRNFIAKVMGRPVTEVTDAEVRGIINAARRAIDGKGTASQFEPAGAAMASTSTKQNDTAESAIAKGYTLKVYRGVSKSKPFNESGTVWATTSKEVAQAYAEEVFSYDDADVITMMVKTDGLKKTDMRKASNEELDAFEYGAFTSPQNIGIYTNSDDSPLGSAYSHTVVHVPVENAIVIKDAQTNPNILFSTAPKQSIERAKAIGDSIIDRMKPTVDALIYNYQDKFVDLKNIQKKAAPKTEKSDAYLAAEQYPGTVRAKTDDFHDDQVDPLIKAIHETGLKYDEVQEYLWAKHAPEYNAVMKERNPTADELETMKQGLSDTRDSLAGVQAVQDYLALRRKLQNANADIADGLSDQATADRYEAEISDLRDDADVAEYLDAVGKLRDLQGAKPFVGDNTALSGMTDERAAEIIAQAKKDGKFDRQEKIAKTVHEITEETRLSMLEGGLITQSESDAWQSLWANYVPFHRDEVSEAMPRIGQGFNVRGKESRHATGSTKDVTNILAHVMAQREAAIIRVEKVKVERVLANFIKENPDSEIWELDTAKMVNDLDKKTGLVVRRVDPTFKNMPNVLTYKVAGKEHTITFNEKNVEAMRLAAALKNMSAAELGDVTLLVGKITRFLATMNTSANPVFVATNFMRDLQTAFVNLSDTELHGMKKEVFRNIPKAIRGMWSMSRGKLDTEWSKHAREFRDAGGQVGYTDYYKDISARALKLQDQLEGMGDGKWNWTKREAAAYWNVIEDANLAVENGVRLAAFVAARNTGMSIAKSASLAKNLTVNFNRHGAKGIELNMWYMFMNASIQGTARLFQAAKNKNVQKIIGGVVASGFLLDILARAMAGDDDDDGENDYDQLPEYVKQKKFVFWVDGTPVTIPMPYGYNFFSNVGRKMSQSMFQKDYSPARGAVELFAVAFDAFSPTGMSGSALQLAAPTIADPFVQWAENKNFTGNPMRKEQSPFGLAKPEYQMGFKSVSAPSQSMAESLNTITGGNQVRPGWLNVNPALFDFAVTSAFGGAGRTYLQLISLPVKTLKGDDIQAREVPFANIFMSAKPEAQIERKFFDTAKAVETVSQEIKLYAGDPEKMADIRERHTPEIRMMAMEKYTSGILRAIRKNEMHIEKNNPPNKRELLKRLDERRNSVMAAFNKRYSQQQQSSK